MIGPNRRWLVLFLMLAAFAGCSRGPRTYPVTGTVKMDGAPLADAMVLFTDPSVRQSAVGRTDASGTFALSFLDKIGAPVGNYKVSISKQGKSTEIDGLFIEQVPARYNRATELTAQVTKEGPNSFSFDHLTSERDAKDAPQTGAPDPAAAKAKTEEANDDALLKQLDPARDDRK